jgi:tetratricopeptide (TPR) repeat protein
MSLTNLSEVLARSGNLPAAREAVDKAVRLRRDLLEQSPELPERRRALAASYNTLGALLWKMRDLPGARQAHEEALKLRTALAADFPSRPDDRQEEAASHNNLGVVLLTLKNLPEARRHFEASQEIKEKLAKDFPRKAVYRRDLALGYNSLGAVLFDLGEKEAARKAFEQALRVRQDLARDFPRVPDYRKDVVASLCNVGQVLEKFDDGAGALKAFREAAEEADRLVKDSPGAAVHHALQGLAHKLVADRLKEDKKYAEALPDYDRAIDVLTRSPPAGDVDVPAELRNSYMGRAEVLYHLGQDASAEADWEQALKRTPPAEQWAVRYGRATALWRAGRFTPAAAALEELVRPPETTAAQDYDAACLLALIATDVKDSSDDRGARQHYASRCVELLRRAQSGGLFKDPAERERFRTNPDFAALRQREDFRALAAELK